MRIDRVKLIAEMARRDMKVQELAEKATVSRATVTALRGGKSCNENSVLRVAQALGVPLESLLDDLQLLADGKAKDRYQAITGISIALHELAQTTGILVVALAQLNRNADRIVPSTADLKESGQLEQDADAVLLLVEKVVTNDGGESFQASLAKNKEGLTGTIPIWFDKERQRFLEIDARR